MCLEMFAKICRCGVCKSGELEIWESGDVGDSLGKSVREIWEETSQHFYRPGPECYANVSNDVIFSKKTKEWPLKKQATLEILSECPSYNQGRLPEFYKRMGLN